MPSSSQVVSQVSKAMDAAERARGDLQDLMEESSREERSALEMAGIEDYLSQASSALRDASEALQQINMTQVLGVPKAEVLAELSRLKEKAKA